MYLIGNVHFKQAAYDQAIDYYEKAKVIYLQDSVKFIKNIASCIGNIGAASIEKGDFEKANALYIQAAELKKEHYGENSTSLAYTYYNIGGGFAEQGDFQSALDYFLKSVRIIRKSKGEAHPDVAFVYNGIGLIYSRTGDWEEANKYYQQALAIREKTRTTDHPETAKDYDRIGGVYQEKGDLIGAKAAYEKALAIRQKAFEPNHKVFADSYTNLASIYMSNNELNKAENLIKKGLAIQEKNFEPYHYAIATTYLQLANVAKLRNNLREALDYYQIAMNRFVPEFESLHLGDNPEITASFPHKTNITDILYRKGTTLKQYYLQQPDSIQFLRFAFNTLQKGSQVADLNRQGFGSDYSKKAFLNNAFLVYKNLVNVGALLSKQPNSNITPNMLFALMEKNKSILLLESLKEETAKEFAGVPKAYIQQENLLKKQIAYFENQLVGRKERGVPPTDNRLMELEEKVFQLRQKHQDLVQLLEDNHPKYHQLKYESEVVSIADIQEYLPHDSAALLQYSLSPSQLYVMAITPTAILQYQQAVDSTFFNQLATVKQFLNTNPADQPKKNSNG